MTIDTWNEKSPSEILADIQAMTDAMFNQPQPVLKTRISIQQYADLIGVPKYLHHLPHMLRWAIRNHQERGA